MKHRNYINATGANTRDPKLETMVDRYNQRKAFDVKDGDDAERHAQRMHDARYNRDIYNTLYGADESEYPAMG